MADNLILMDGTKAIPLNQLPKEAWTIISGEDDPGDLEKTYTASGWLFRCVNIRSNGMLTLPWALLQQNNPIWRSIDQEPPEQLEWLRKLPIFLSLTEASLVLKGEAFWFKQTKGTKILGLQWLMPNSMKPKWDKNEGLVGFIRKIGNDEVFYKKEEIVYFSLPNPIHETKPGLPPAVAALSAAKVNVNMDLFIQKFFERGAIKATVLSLAATAPKTERMRLRRWWRRIANGIKGAWTTEVISGAVNPVVIGEGVSDLGDQKLTKEKKEDIATTLGIPHSLVFSNSANRATAIVDERSLYTHTLVPSAKIISMAVNQQLLNPLGYHLRFRHQELSIFQLDEQERSVAYLNFIKSGMKPSIAAQVLGIDLPLGISYEELDKNIGQSPVFGEEMAAPDDEDNDVRDEVARFKKWAKKRMFSSSFSIDDFNSDVLSRRQKQRILDTLR